MIRITERQAIKQNLVWFQITQISSQLFLKQNEGFHFVRSGCLPSEYFVNFFSPCKDIFNIIIRIKSRL